MNLVEKELEENWLAHEEFKDLKCTIEERKGVLYVQGTKLCKLNDIERVYTDEDAIVVNSKKDAFYICIHWGHFIKPYICQIYAKSNELVLYRHYEKPDIEDMKRYQNRAQATIIDFIGTSEWYRTLIGTKVKLIKHDERFGEDYYALYGNEHLLIKKIHTSIYNPYEYL